ncbi:hypothetical protein G647_10425 [Cladophialophora carrionii CBS 160.54]|uniref:Uncharacterized protein n=1 Tax=Cladophialophora carrionii CBS 160.54 TaxID=1279043 RepID=V9DIV3_9EURO|nr:uncharacterized protein G647_10425 [Cladophialophora carrionii CBS 160.54]ETI26611.1 hypothetical protein G647_10425 [Cladophialophora carrionii CBS 160.54]
MARAMLEVKRWLIHLVDDRTVRHDAYYWSDEERGCYFTPFTSWDFLLSTTARGDKAILVSRDDLPVDWFAQQPELTRTAAFAAGFLERHTLHGVKPLEDGRADAHARRGLAAQMIAIWDRYRSEGKFCARRHLEWHHISAPTVDLGPEGAPLDATAPARASPPSNPGHGGPPGALFQRRMYPSRQAAIFNGVCAAHNNCAVYKLGRHPSATHIFALGRADGIVDLHPDTPMVYLNFAQVDILHSRPHDKQIPSSFFPATHGKSKSIYVLSPVPEELDDLPHHHFVLPSEALCTESRVRVNDEQLKPRLSSDA